MNIQFELGITSETLVEIGRLEKMILLSKSSQDNPKKKKCSASSKKKHVQLRGVNISATK